VSEVTHVPAARVALVCWQLCWHLSAHAVCCNCAAPCPQGRITWVNNSLLMVPPHTLPTCLPAAELSFHGLVIGQAGAGAGPGGPSVAVDGGAVPHRLVVRAPLRNERLRPEAKLTAVAVPLRPCEVMIEPLATGRGEVMALAATISQLAATAGMLAVQQSDVWCPPVYCVLV
jgi:hypothetical protein